MSFRAVLVAPTAFDGLRAPEAAAAIGRGLEAAGFEPPALCPLAAGGAGTIEVLLPVLGGETGDGFALVEAGATALVEAAGEPEETAARIAAAAAAGPAVIVLAAVDAGTDHAAVALAAAGDLARARAVVLRHDRDAGAVPGAVIESGVRFVLDALDIDPRLRAARAVVVGAARLDEGWLRGGVEGEVAVRARQAGVPCHAVVARCAVDPFEARMLDLQRIVEAPERDDLERAGAALADVL